ncbi:MAG: hypothetical protein HQL35_14240 [Alphaproteobacteria bacterium]|nr:hypothetical protein [Alphaproteobacteria bacterium]
MDTAEEDEKLRRFLAGEETALDAPPPERIAEEKAKTDGGVTRRGLLRGGFRPKPS